MNIKINNQFSITGDSYNWVVQEWYDGKDKNGNHKRQHKDSYYSSLSHALKIISEKSLLGCESAEEILDRLEKFNAEVLSALGDFEGGIAA